MNAMQMFFKTDWSNNGTETVATTLDRINNVPKIIRAVNAFCNQKKKELIFYRKDFDNHTDMEVLAKVANDKFVQEWFTTNGYKIYLFGCTYKTNDTWGLTVSRKKI